MIPIKDKYSDENFKKIWTIALRILRKYELYEQEF